MSLLSSPIEIIEKILSHLLTPSFVDSSSPTILCSSLRGTTSILLVSRDIRALTLPIFWRTVVVSKQKQWKYLFGGKGRGLLVVDGTEGEERRGWLRDVFVGVNASFYEDGTFGTDFVCSSPISVLRGRVWSLQLVAVVQEGKEAISESHGDASLSDPSLPSLPLFAPPKPTQTPFHQSPRNRIQSLLLSLHVGESLQFILRSLEPQELELPFVDWLFVEDRDRPYLPAIRIRLHAGPSSFGYLSVGMDLEGMAGRVEVAFPKSELRLLGMKEESTGSEE